MPDYENDYGETVYKNYLNVSVSPAAAVEFQHFKDTILTKINSYFGYKAIIDLRIHQNYIPKQYEIKNSMNIKHLSEEEKRNISIEVMGLSNKDLQKSLINLGKNISKETKK